MLRIGLIGFGKMGQIRAKAFEDTKKAEIVSVYEKEVGDDIGYQLSDSVVSIIKSPNVDAVCISVPNYYNFPLTRDALRSGKHVFCEKPPAFTSDEVRELQKLERESGCKLMYGFNHRHHDGVVKIKEILDSGVYGRILWMRGRYGKSVDETYLDTWGEQRKS